MTGIPRVLTMFLTREYRLTIGQAPIEGPGRPRSARDKG